MLPELMPLQRQKTSVSVHHVVSVVSCHRHDTEHAVVECPPRGTWERSEVESKKNGDGHDGGRTDIGGEKRGSWALACSWEPGGPGVKREKEMVRVVI